MFGRSRGKQTKWCCTQRLDGISGLQSAGLQQYEEVDSVFVTGMLGAHIQSKLVESVSQVLKFEYGNADHIINTILLLQVKC